MNTILIKIASVLAFVIGAMAIFAGAKPLLGSNPGYYVINWLPLYNYTIGVLTIFVTAILIWMNSKIAMPAAIATLSVNVAVILILQTAYRGIVAPDSLQAMTIRVIVWVMILLLMFFQARKKRI